MKYLFLNNFCYLILAALLNVAGLGAKILSSDATDTFIGSEEPVLVLEDEVLHKYYISVSNASYNASAKSVQMISRFFIDDMEDVLNARLNQPVVLGETSQLDELKPILDAYLQKKLQVELDGKKVTPQFLGAEYEADQIVLYIELPSETAPKQVSMTFTALLELFTDQKNLVHLDIDGKRKTLLMKNNKSTDSVKF